MPAARVVFPASDQAEIAAAVTEMLASGALTLGPYTRGFEAAFAAAHTGPRPPSPDGPHAVAVASGTAALTIALLALGVRGREVVVPANTFYATAAAVLQAGARPVFADVEAGTFALSAATTAAALTPRTAAVVTVHIGGLISPQIDELRALCDERGIALVEDAAHAHGATFDGRFAGSFGAAAAFSFYPTKVVTSGEGGMVLTGSEELAQEARIYRDQGKGAFSANHHVRLGSAWRMSELHAATGLVHLRRMEEFIARRRAVAARYDKALGDLDGIQPLAEPPGCRSNIYKYIALLPPGLDRARFKSELAQRFQVYLSGEVYDLPLHRQPVLAEYAGPPLPVAEELAARHICLPVHSDMTDSEVDEVLTAVAAVQSAFTGW
ncbi:MAG TPA: DegT/DnrJ/EryC1/StrS aminotransferase family protein [Streptosporangiaceae bacterium]|nr:DegT/DnrJ/EryC1/StrS aminotransferase family protein [Streptosporangiaceae bacterium]